MSQSRYIKELLKLFAMQDCNPVLTPLEVGVKLVKRNAFSRRKDENHENPSPYPYRELIGALNYIAMTTRPDIA